MCIFVIPVTFAWHLNPPPHRSRAVRTGIRLAIHIEFKSQDQNFSLKTPSRWIPIDICVWWLLFQIGATPSVLFRCHLDSGLRFNFHKDCWGNILWSFRDGAEKNASDSEAAWHADASITCNVVTAGSRLQMRASMCESRSRLCVFWCELD